MRAAQLQQNDVAAAAGGGGEGGYSLFFSVSCWPNDKGQVLQHPSATLMFSSKAWGTRKHGQTPLKTLAQ